MNTTLHTRRAPIDWPHTRWHFPPVAFVLGGLALLAGCVETPEAHVVSSPPPNTAVLANPSTSSGQVVVVPGQTPPGTVILNQAPPATPQIITTHPPRPSSDYEWVEGHWTYRSGSYEWINGHWEIPPYAGARWVQPHSEQRSDGNYTYYEGHWSSE